MEPAKKVKVRARAFVTDTSTGKSVTLKRCKKPWKSMLNREIKETITLYFEIQAVHKSSNSHFPEIFMPDKSVK